MELERVGGDGADPSASGTLVRFDTVIDEHDLGPLLQRRRSRLSGGERAACAPRRVLIAEPAVLTEPHDTLTKTSESLQQSVDTPDATIPRLVRVLARLSHHISFFREIDQVFLWRVIST